VSSNGYTPLFGSLTTGTLCGKWPDIGLWPIVLSLADKNGVVDVTHQYISTVTGLALSEVVECMKRFCQPDYGSRSSAESGARLLLLEDHREWGWQIVNHSLYRERARLMSQNNAQVADGRNAEKVRRYKERHPKTPADTAGHPQTPRDTLSDSDANKEKKAAIAAEVVLHESLPKETWEEWLAHRKEKRLTMSPRALKTQLKLLARYDSATQREMIETSINAGWEGIFAPKGAKPTQEPRRGLPTLRV